MTNLRITKKLIDALEPASNEYIIWDSDLTGFGVRVRPSGYKCYIVQYRAGSGRQGKSKKLTIGEVGKLTPEEARAVARKHVAAIMTGEDPANSKAVLKASPTISVLSVSFLKDHVKAKRKPKTYELYEGLFRNHINPRLGDKKAIDATVGDWAKFHQDLVDTPIIANRALNTAAAMYSWGGDHGKIPEGLNPTRKVERYPEEGRERYLTKPEYRRLHEVLGVAETTGLVWEPKPGNDRPPKAIEDRTLHFSPYVIAAIRLFLFTGKRLREILHMRWDEYDEGRGSVLIPDSKNGKTMLILSEAAMAVINDLPRSGDYIIAGKSPKKPRSDIKRPWARLREAAGLSDVRIHDLRHSFASVGVGGGYGLPIVGKLLGHTQAKTTQKYAHLDAEPMRRVSNEIGRRIQKSMLEGNGPRASREDRGGIGDNKKVGRESEE